MSRTKVAVVGVGTVGAQVLWQLAQRECDVTGYELYAPGHSQGAAGGETRLYRNIEIEDLRYTPIVDRADELWKKLEHDSQRSLREISGALVMGDENSPETQRALAAARASARDIRVLSREESLREYPEFALDPNDITIVDREGGIIKPELTVAAAAAMAEQHGAELVRGTRVTSIVPLDGGGARITASGVARDFDRVVVAAGAWTSTLLPDLTDQFLMRRLVSAWFFSRDPGHLARVLPFIRTQPSYAYGLPVPDRTAMKLGLGFDHHLPIDSPDHADLHVPDNSIAAFAECARRYMPGLDSYPMRIGTYFESYTPSRHEFVQEHPRMTDVLVFAGFSGHGFKMAPAMGELGADLALGTPAHIDVGFLRKEMGNAETPSVH